MRLRPTEPEIKHALWVGFTTGIVWGVILAIMTMDLTK